MAALEELANAGGELSGLHNYRFLRETLRLELGEAAENGTRLAVIMLDLNDFKTVNDRFGHQAGDALIAAIGRAVDNEVRGRGIVARYGGDEFTVLLPDTDSAGAHDVAVTVARAIEEASVGATSANQHLRVTAAYGIAVYPNDAADAEALIAHADRALYEAKAQLMDVRSRSEERHAQDVFFAIGEAISSSLDPEMLVSNLVRQVATTLDLDTCSIWVVGSGSERLRVPAFFVTDDDLPRKVNEIQRMEPITRAEAIRRELSPTARCTAMKWCTRRCSPQRFRDILEPNTWMITTPLQGVGEGFLMLMGRHGRSAPLPTSLAEAIARLASAALQNAETYARAHKQAEQLRALAGLGGLLLGEGSYEDRLGAVVERVAQVTNCEMLTMDARIRRVKGPSRADFMVRRRMAASSRRKTSKFGWLRGRRSPSSLSLSSWNA